MDSVCKFVPTRKTDDILQVLNFVYEGNIVCTNKPQFSASYAMCLVTEGTGILKVYDKSYALKKGMLFFIFPAVPYELTELNNFGRMYISYIGVRAKRIMDKHSFSPQNPVYDIPENLTVMWTSALHKAQNRNIEILSESVLLYTLSELTMLMPTEDESVPNDSALLAKLKKYVDENFSNSTLSLETLSQHFSYHKKYISYVFSRYLNIGFSSYLNTVRIQYACELFEAGLSCVKDVSHMCGFSDQMYFSKIFKKKIGSSPSEYVRQRKSNA